MRWLTHEIKYMRNDVFNEVATFIRNDISNKEDSDVKKYLSQMFKLACIVYIAITIYLYQQYSKKIKTENENIIEECFHKIVKITTKRLNSLAQELGKDINDKYVSIRCDNNKIIVCYEQTNCISYDVFRLGASIDSVVPKFIFYKIELNKTLLHSNVNIRDYPIDKVYHINNHNQLNIGLLVNNVDRVEASTKKPFLVPLCLILLNVAFLYVISKVLFNKLSKSYYIKNKTKIDNLKLKHVQELKDHESTLMKVIWNLEFNKRKDLEINCLFAFEANKIALCNNIVDEKEYINKNLKLNELGSKLPCSIVLYQKSSKTEKVNIIKLIDLFTERFASKSEDISIKISGSVDMVRFVSTAALYQIIYSLISYLSFVLKERSLSKPSIDLFIQTVGQNLKLCFKYTGLVMKEEEFMRLSCNFFKTHANPFILNIEQIFDILRNDNFKCRINNKSNIIEIVRQTIKKKKIKSNVIPLFSLKPNNK